MGIRYIERVFATLASERPARLRYASFRLDDAVSLLHVVSHESKDERNALHEVGSHRFFPAETLS